VSIQAFAQQQISCQIAKALLHHGADSYNAPSLKIPGDGSQGQKTQSELFRKAFSESQCKELEFYLDLIVASRKAQEEHAREEQYKKEQIMVDYRQEQRLTEEREVRLWENDYRKRTASSRNGSTKREKCGYTNRQEPLNKSLYPHSGSGWYGHEDGKCVQKLKLILS
jgi:hypothetical protein